MFVESHVTLPVSASVARPRLARALAAAADEPAIDAEPLTLRVGPGRQGVRKRVQLQTLDPREVGTSVVVPLRWEATGPTGGWFPTLDADLTLTCVDDVTSVLSLLGAYRPPFGSVGAALDHAALRKVAQHTVDEVLRRIASCVACTPVLNGRSEP